MLVFLRTVENEVEVEVEAEVGRGAEWMMVPIEEGSTAGSGKEVEQATGKEGNQEIGIEKEI